MDEHLNCFQFLTIPNNALKAFLMYCTKYRYMKRKGNMCFPFSSIYIGVEQLGHMVGVCLNFKKLFSKVVVLFIFTTAVYESSNSTFLIHTWYSLFNFCHLNSYVAYHIVTLICITLMINDVECPCASLPFMIVESSIQIVCPIL